MNVINLGRVTLLSYTQRGSSVEILYRKKGKGKKNGKIYTDSFDGQYIGSRTDKDTGEVTVEIA